MLTSKPFRDFCRNHFVDKNGEIKSLNDSTPDARQKRRELTIKRLENKQSKLNKQLSSLYKEIQAMRESEEEAVYIERVKPKMVRVAALRNDIESLRKKIDRISGKRRSTIKVEEKAAKNA